MDIPFLYRVVDITSGEQVQRQYAWPADVAEDYNADEPFMEVLMVFSWFQKVHTPPLCDPIKKENNVRGLILEPRRCGNSKWCAQLLASVFFGFGSQELSD